MPGSNLRTLSVVGYSSSTRTKHNLSLMLSCCLLLIWVILLLCCLAKEGGVGHGSNNRQSAARELSGSSIRTASFFFFATIKEQPRQECWPWRIERETNQNKKQKKCSIFSRWCRRHNTAEPLSTPSNMYSSFDWKGTFWISFWLFLIGNKWCINMQITSNQDRYVFPLTGQRSGGYIYEYVQSGMVVNSPML